ncbi:MAG: diacylglycerol kinase [Gemmataceae bacterium]
MALLVPTSDYTDENEQQEHRKRARRTWVHKFQDAFRGLKFGVRGQSSFFVHFFFAALVVVAAAVLQCSVIEWCILLGCIGFVLVAEMFNSAIETLFRGLHEDARNQVWPCLDIAAGAVLVASCTAAIIGSIVFVNRLLVIWNAASN